MIDQWIVRVSLRNALPFLITERILHAISMGATTLLPAYFLKRDLDEIYFGSISTVSAVFAVTIILILPGLMRFFAVKNLALTSAAFLFTGYASLFYGELSGKTVDAFGYLGFPLISAGWVIHFTLGTIKVSGASSDHNRQQNFMIYAAFSTLGISLGPIAGNLILSTSGGYALLFASLMIFAMLGLLTSIATLSLDTNSPTSTTGGDTRVSLAALLRMPAAFFVVMVFLQSAIFTIIINFQVVFGELNGLHSSVFFLCWAAGIMVPRLVLRDWIAGLDNQIILPSLTMCLALSLFALATGPVSNTLYGLTAVSLGVFYGLSYPIVQAETVRFAAPGTRSFFLVAFSLGYFVSYYVTPLAAGYMVSKQGYNLLFAAAGVIGTTMAVAEFYFYWLRRGKASSGWPAAKK